MARLNNDFTFTGRIGRLTAYKMSGVKQIVVRSIGGPTAEQIKNLPQFKTTRAINAEWKGVMMSRKALRLAIMPVNHLRDYNYASILNRITGNIMKAGSNDDSGTRPVLFSQFNYLLEGFDLNENNLLHSVVSSQIRATINRESLSATIELPEIIPGINLRNYQKLPFYRFVFNMGTISDFAWDEAVQDYRPIDKDNLIRNKITTEWLQSNQKRPAETLELPSLNFEPIGDHTSIIIAGGIEFGMPTAVGSIEFVPRSGSGKILVVG